MRIPIFPCTPTEQHRLLGRYAFHIHKVSVPKIGIYMIVSSKDKELVFYDSKWMSKRDLVKAIANDVGMSI